MADAQQACYQDLVEYGMVLRAGGSRTLEQSDIRTMVQGAYTDIAMAADWQYFDTEYRLNLQESYSTGTVTYDHTGHASGERALTISGGTWPSWIANGRLRINGKIYKVDRVSASAATILLDSVLCPTEDIATATSYIAYQSVYQLPADLLTIEDLLVEDGTWNTFYMEPGRWMQYERITQHEGRPFGWTMMKDPKHVGRWAVFVNTIPSVAEPLGFIYRRRPRTLRYAGTESVARILLSGTAGAYTVTTTTTLPQAMVGAMLRIGDVTNYPTGLAGQFPFVEQHEIYSIAGTTVTLRTPLLATTDENTKSVATDPIDMSESMIEALKARFEFRLNRGFGDGEAQGRNVVRTMQMADRELRIAMERDSRVQVSNKSAFVPFSVWAGRVSVVTAS